MSLAPVGPDLGTVLREGVAEHVSTTIDPYGRPLVAAWRDVGTPEARLTLSRRVGDQWSTEVVAGANGAFCSVAAAPDGTPYVAFTDLDSSTVMLASGTADPAVWLTEKAARPGSGVPTRRPALAVGGGGRPEICFASAEGACLSVRNAPGSWSTQVLDPGTSTAADLALAIGPADSHHVLVRDALTDTLVHLHDGSGEWRRDEVPWREEAGEGGFLGDRPALAVGADGEVHVAVWTHAGISHGTLRGGEPWRPEVVVPEADAGGAPVLAIGSDGHPTIGCPDAATGGVRLVVRDASAWTATVIGASEDALVTGSVSLAITGGGPAHLVLVDDHTGEVRTALVGEVPPEPALTVRTTVDTPLRGSLLPVGGGGDELGLDTVPVSAPRHGLLRLQAGGAFVYTPDRGHQGTDGFEYAVQHPAGYRSIGGVRIAIDVPTLITVSQQRLKRARRASTVKITLETAALRGRCVVLQRRRNGVWVDLHKRKGLKVALLMRAGRQGWPPGPYRLELRPGKRRYPLARSKAFRKPPDRGVRIVVSGDLSTLPR